MTHVLLLLVLLLYAKWIALLLLYPLLALKKGVRDAGGGLRLWRVPLAAPGALVERLLRGGGERFVLYHISFIPSIRLRRVLYRGLGAHIGPRAIVHFRAEIRCPERLVLGGGTIVGDNALLDARRGLTMGKHVNLSSNVSVYTLQHDHRDPLFGCPEEHGGRKMSVEIGDRAWLGANVTVLPGVRVGEGAVCCAGCVVTGDVAPYTVVAGIPAREVGRRPEGLEYEFTGRGCRLY